MTCERAAPRRGSKRLKRENAELRRANDILKAAAHFFGQGSTAKVLRIAPSTYHAAKTRLACDCDARTHVLTTGLFGCEKPQTRLTGLGFFVVVGPN